MADPVKILVVDDNDAHRYFVCRTLEQAGYLPNPVRNGDAAIQHAQELPALVLLDVQLPDIDGFEICRRLKADPRTRNIPVVMFSAIEQDGSAVNHARQLGVSSFLFFPMAADQLLVAVRGALMKAAKESAHRSST